MREEAKRTEEGEKNRVQERKVRKKEARLLRSMEESSGRSRSS